MVADRNERELGRPAMATETNENGKVCRCVMSADLQLKRRKAERRMA